MTSISLAAKDILSVDSKHNQLWVGQAETLRRDLIQGIIDFQARPSTSYNLKRYPAGPNELLSLKDMPITGQGNSLIVLQQFIHLLIT